MRRKKAKLFLKKISLLDLIIKKEQKICRRISIVISR